MGMFMGLPLDLEYSCASEGLLTIHYQPRFATSGVFIALEQLERHPQHHQRLEDLFPALGDKRLGEITKYLGSDIASRQF